MPKRRKRYADPTGWLDSFKPEKGQTVEDFAKTLYYAQCDFYDAHAMSSFDWPAFEYLGEGTRKGWLKSAKKRMRKWKRKKNGSTA